MEEEAYLLISASVSMRAGAKHMYLLPGNENVHIAMVDEHLPVDAIATCDRNDFGSVLRYEKNVSNIEAYKKQSGRVIAIATEGDTTLNKISDQVIYVPQAPELLSPILEIIPLQLFAYYMTVKKGLDVDKPRNLVKSPAPKPRCNAGARQRTSRASRFISAPAPAISFAAR